MKAIIINEYGNREKLEYADMPDLAGKPLDSQSVLVKTKLAGVNFIDVYLREGIYKVGALPFILGKEGLGEVVEVGSEVMDFKVGDIALLLMGGTGSYAETIVANQSELVKVPAEMDMKKVLAAGLQGFTAHYLVNNSYPIKSGDTVLVHAGAGGVGHQLIQMAKKKGARVITTVSTEEKKAKVLSYGVDEVIIYKDYEFDKEVMRLTDDKGVDAVYDSVGQATFDQSLRVIKTRGTMVTFGQSSGVIPPFNVGRLNQEGALFLTRPSLAHHIQTREETDGRAKDIFSMLNDNSLQIDVGNCYPLQNASQAHEDLELRRSSGKLILEI